MIRVVTFLWDDPKYRFNDLFRYGPRHVNTLARSVKRNLSMDHEFCVITDQDHRLFPDVDRVITMWPDLRDLGGCYTRLRAFAPDMADIIGERFVWMDLDCVVTGVLDPLLDRPEDFVIWRNDIGRTPYCGSMVMMTAGARSKVWRSFDPQESPGVVKRNTRYVGTDQAWVSYVLENEAVWLRQDGVLSRLDVGLGKLKKRHAAPLPAHARVVFFHGAFDPSVVSAEWIDKHWR